MVICHMMSSVDGRIDITRWKVRPQVIKEYERTAQSFDADGWLIGRVSMEPYAGKARVPERGKHAPAIPRTDHLARRAGSYAIAIDPSGKLRWTSGMIDDEHVVTVLTEAVSDDYLAFLRARGVSYLFGGKKKLDLGRVLAKLSAQLAIRTLLLEGGGKVNGSFLAAGLVDELSVLIAPLVDGGSGIPTLFDARTRAARTLALRSVERRPGGVLWLRYRALVKSR
jgi:riboflavin biosynthesis pyrimidine reductase